MSTVRLSTRIIFSSAFFQRSVGWALFFLAGLLVNPFVQADPLVPPGPPGPTFKTLGEIEPRSFLRPREDVIMPLVINQPGSYYLIDNVKAIPDNPAILIVASNVTLDLNGYTVSGNLEVTDGDGIRIEGANVTVRNGTVQYADENGISCPNDGPITLIDVNALNNAESGAFCEAIRVSGGEFSYNGNIGVGGATALIADVRAVGNVIGIYLGPGSAASRSLSNNNTYGFRCLSPGALVTQSSARFNSTANNFGCDAFDSSLP